jgi:excisionase family DNA binding protein
MGAVTDRPKLIGAREAAAMLGVSVDTIRRAVQEGRLPAVRLRHRGWLKFNVDEIERLCSPTAAGEDAILVEAAELAVEGVLVEQE